VTATGFTSAANNGTSVITAVTATRLTVTKTPKTVAEAAAPGRSIAVALNNAEAAGDAANRTVTTDARLTVTRTGAITVAGAAARTITGEIIFRAVAAGTTTPIIAEWTAPPGEPASPSANLQALGGATQGGSAILGLLVPRSAHGTGAPQTASTATTPGFRVPTFIFAIDKHPR
jgi:hypothetical protein